jgi:NAD(P)H dehydrogenase (quinone)
MPTKVQIVFHSVYGHIWRMAEAVAQGCREVPDTEVTLSQVHELLSDEILMKMQAREARKQFAHIPFADPKQLVGADAIIFGSPTRYGSVTASMQNFLDATGSLWAAGKLIGKVASGFTSTGTQHGGQETTLLGLYTFFIHQGMLISGAPYSIQEITNMNEITGGSPYGAGTIAGGQGQRLPSENELTIARKQGRHVTEIAKKLTRP